LHGIGAAREWIKSQFERYSKDCGGCLEVKTNLDNDSTLKWEPSVGAGSYEVIWRATSSPVWEHAQNIGNATTISLKLSKDNVIFAVRSVDREGHRSLPVPPLPER
jgi:hypothetical protein